MKNVLYSILLIVLISGCCLFRESLPQRGWDEKYIVDLPKEKQYYTFKDGIQSFKIAIVTDGYRYIKGLKSTEINKDFYSNNTSVEMLPQKVFDGLLSLAIKKSKIPMTKKIILKSYIKESKNDIADFIWQMEIIEKNKVQWKKTIFLKRRSE